MPISLQQIYTKEYIYLWFRWFLLGLLIFISLSPFQFILYWFSILIFVIYVNGLFVIRLQV